MARQRRGLIFANLVDFDTLYGHRNDVAGYAANLERFDARLSQPASEAARATICWSITADHGNDPDDAEHRSFARTRAGAGGRASACRNGVDLGTRATFADLGQTLAEVFGVPPLAQHGTSFLSTIRRSAIIHPRR